MNILVRRSDGLISVRPDSSLQRTPQDYYAPDWAGEILAAPVFYTKVSRAGKAVRPEFAGRYISGGGFGVLLYASALPESEASILDGTTYICPPEVEQGAALRLRIDGSTVFEGAAPDAEELAELVCRASARCYIRTGDLLCTELSAPLKVRSLIEGYVNGEKTIEIYLK